jgi:hypothetical protein
LAYKLPRQGVQRKSFHFKEEHSSLAPLTGYRVGSLG